MGCSTPEVRRLIVKARKRGCTMNEITEMFEVSRWTVWRWMKRAHHPGRESYRDKSRRPHTIHKKITQQVENAIIILRDSFSWGSQRIKVVLSSPPPYIRYFLESVLGTKWNPILLSRQSINNTSIIFSGNIVGTVFHLVGNENGNISGLNIRMICGRSTSKDRSPSMENACSP